MRAIAIVALALAMSSTALAGPQSTIGGKRLRSDMVHNTGVGWPSLFYEWWNKGRGNLDWALGAELVYGDWWGRVEGGAVLPVRARTWHRRREPHVRRRLCVSHLGGNELLVGPRQVAESSTRQRCWRMSRSANAASSATLTTRIAHRR